MTETTRQHNSIRSAGPHFVAETPQPQADRMRRLQRVHRLHVEGVSADEKYHARKAALVAE